MDLSMFVNGNSGQLVEIAGNDPREGGWTHKAFIPTPLPSAMPEFNSRTFLSVMDARAALAGLDATARQLPNPRLLRMPTLRREAQSTSALEGTYAPLSDVLTADEDEPRSAELVEILNYVQMANLGFAWVIEGRPITAGMIADLQGVLMTGTELEEVSGRLRETQVVVGRRPDADPADLPIHSARFVPSPPGDQLASGVEELLAWMSEDHRREIDPVISAAMSHYQFEALHPFRDGNGRLGRFLIVLHLLTTGILSEPTLTVSPWFEARRGEYYDVLLGVSTRGDWDAFVTFFANGLQEAAETTKAQMIALVAVQSELKEMIRSSTLRAGSAHSVVDVAVANPSFTVRKVESELNLSYGRANKLVSQLVDLGILSVLDDRPYKRRFFAPRVLDALLGKTR